MLKNKIMKKIICVIFSLIASIPIIAQTTGTMTDSRDGKTYKTIKIGDQIWMSENLNYKTPTGSWCYNDNSANCNKYGRLYDYETALTIAPEGWHIPTKSDLKILL